MNYPQSRVLVLGATYGTGNMGVDALLSGSISSIWLNEPDAEIVLLDFGSESKVIPVPSHNGMGEVRLENIRFSWKIWMFNNGFRLLFLALLLKALPSNGLRRWCFRTHPALEVISDSKVALSLAGGDSFSDIYGFRRLLYVCLPQFIVEAVETPLILLPQTLGPFKAGWAKFMGKKVMEGAQKVYSRDRESIRIAGEMIGEPDRKLAYSHDMAFALRPAYSRGREPEWAIRDSGSRPLVGFNVSGLLYMGGYTRDNMFGLAGDYPQLVRKLIRFFVVELGTELVLVTHVSGWEDDAAACQTVYDELKGECEGRLHLADPGFDHREIKYLIGKCQFFMGARMHACIAALSQGIPAVGMAYSRKFAGVFESVDVPELVVDLRELSCDDAVQSIGDLYRKREAHADRLAVAAPRARQSAEGLFGLIRTELNSSVMAGEETCASGVPGTQ